MWLTNGWVLLNTFLYVALGVFTFVKPQALANAIGYELTTATAQAELKATYGGLMIILGVIIALFHFRISQQAALAIIPLLYIGFGSGRILGMIIHQAWDKTSLSYFAFEVVGIILGGIFYYYAEVK